MIRQTLLSVLLAMPLMATSAMALTATQTVEREVIVQNADGSQTVKREKADLVTPGDKVVYSLNYYNDKEETAANIVLVMPVPTEISYVEGSAEVDNTLTVYSADGGQTFEARDVLKVQSADGAFRVARAEDITHIRWTVGSAIIPGGTGTLSFSGRLK